MEYLKQPWNYKNLKNNNSWVLKPCMDLLLAKGCDTNVIDNFGESLVNFVIAHQKMKTFEDLIKHGVDLNLRDQLGVNPITQIFKHNNHKALDIVLKQQLVNVHDTLIIDDTVTPPKKYTPLHFFCKKIRKYGFKNEEKNMFEVLLQNEIYAINDNEKLGIQR